MGFSAGGSNVLKNHKHDATVVQDGGSLDADNVTSADLTAGDVIFSDGVHLQRLAIGTPAQQIQVNAGATAPEYFTPASAGSNYEFLGNANGTSVTSLSVSFTGVVNPDYVIAVYNGDCQAGQGVDWRINALNASSSYSMIGSYLSGNPAVQGLQNNPDDKIYGALSGVVAGSPAGVIVTLKAYVNPIANANASGVGNIQYENSMLCDGAGVRANISQWSCVGSNVTAGQTSITSIEILGAAFSGSLDVWAVRN